MALKIPVAHDFICPWCWVGIKQARRLQDEEGVEIDWLAYELFPEELEWPDYASAPENPNKPPTLTRFQFLLELEEMTMPPVERPKKMRTHNAHEAVEYAKSCGDPFDFVEALYEAYWLKGIDINNPDYLLTLGKAYNLDPSELAAAIETKAFSANIVGFDDPAYAKGVYNVPTFFIGGDRWAEQPYRVLQAQVRKINGEPAPRAPYKNIALPMLESRAYVCIDMVATIDGKIISGQRDEPVLDLGSALDHQAMHNLENAVDAVLIGAGTLAATPATWSTRARVPLVMTRSGKINLNHSFLKSPESIIIMPEGADLEGRTQETVMRSSHPHIDPLEILAKLKKNGVDRVLVLGGSSVNALFFERNLVDEIFLTIAPKIKLGDSVPTIAGGVPLDREDLLGFELVSHEQIGNELFLRYCKPAKE